jgi:hypothetical protein
MIKKILFTVAGSLTAATTHADSELLSVADAELVLGPNVMDLSGDDAEFQCLFLGGSPQGTFIVQFNPRDYYEQATILEPHTPADVGEQGRTNVDTNGVTALQFVQGDRSVTMSVRPAASGEPDYLDKLVTVGKRLAERLE